MPELPEIEHLRRTLEPVLIGATVRRVIVHRWDVIHATGRDSTQSEIRGRLLWAGRIEAMERHGKQLALFGSGNKPVLCFHLGMSGQLRYLSAGASRGDLTHVHCEWIIERCENSRPIADSRQPKVRLIFRDPRRFGGIWVFRDRDEMIGQRWNKLGPDALTISAAALREGIDGSHRSIKAALLDQSVLAGVGNIYADEALYVARIHPMTRCDALDRADIARLAKNLRATLRRAITAGGSTLRDYVDGNGEAGGYLTEHRAYGRTGKLCLRCGQAMDICITAGRTTCFCPWCQRIKGTHRHR